VTLISPEESGPVVIFAVRCRGSSLPSLQPRGDAFSLNNQILSEEHHRQRRVVFSVLINGKEKGKMLLLVLCVNLRTHACPAAVRIRLGISSAAGCKSDPFRSEGKELTPKETGAWVWEEGWTGRVARGQGSPSGRVPPPQRHVPVGRLRRQESPVGAGTEGQAICDSVIPTQLQWHGGRCRAVPFGFCSSSPSTVTEVGEMPPPTCRVVCKRAG